MGTKPFETPMLVDDPLRFRVFDYGEWADTFETAAEVWTLIERWEVGRDRIYDGNRIVTREAIRAEAAGA
jgi:hypothetical protein